MQNTHRCVRAFVSRYIMRDRKERLFFGVNRDRDNFGQWGLKFHPGRFSIYYRISCRIRGDSGALTAFLGLWPFKAVMTSEAAPRVIRFLAS